MASNRPEGEGEWHRGKTEEMKQRKWQQGVYLKEIRGTTQKGKKKKLHSKRKYTECGDIQFKRCKRHTQNDSSTQNEKMFICVLTVLGLVRFLASVSQLLRWLYVLLLHDIDRGTQVTMTTGKDLTLTFLRRDRKKRLQLLHRKDGCDNESSST